MIRHLSILISLLCFFFTPAFPCDIPVIRFALERCGADPYLVTVVTERALTDSEQDTLAWLRSQSIESGGPSNMTVQLTTPDQLPPETEFFLHHSSRFGGETRNRVDASGNQGATTIRIPLDTSRGESLTCTVWLYFAKPDTSVLPDERLFDCWMDRR